MPSRANSDTIDLTSPEELAGAARRLHEWEFFVRPFVDPAAGQRLLDRLKAKRRKPGAEAEASITWGQASQFETVKGYPDVYLRTSGDQPQQQDDGTTSNEPDVPQTRTYTELGRTVETVRVENPDDSTQYVMVDRIKSITFSAPDGTPVRFVLNNG